MSGGPLRFGAALGLVFAAGCVSETATKMGLPSAAATARVDLLGVRGPYLDAVIDVSGDRLRFFFPDDDFCRALLERAEAVEYTTRGSYGQVRLNEVTCDPVGILSLEAWRDRRPRPRLSDPVPRDRADYETIYVDEDLFLARGRFPLAGLVGWPGSYDTVAIFPNLPECEELMTRRAATMEFRHSGSEVMVLLDNRIRCQILGFARPVGNR